MKTNKLFWVLLLISSSTFGGQSAWTFTPTTATVVKYPVNVTSSILYTVTNQSLSSQRLVLEPIQGVTQIGTCDLAPRGQAGDSCTLNLSVTGSELPAKGFSGGPVLCPMNQDGKINRRLCSQPSRREQLALTVGPAITDSVDWRARGAVTPVKNQGGCTSDYAFSTTGALEGFYQIQKGTLHSFSEQQLVDCSANSGCEGGTVPTSLQYVFMEGGIATEPIYPYTAYQGICKEVTDIPLGMISYIQVPAKNEIALAEQVIQQPVSAKISVGSWFEDYKGGVISPDCSGDTEYQNVLVVGYEPAYWIIKNSEGTSWGAQGYLYLTRGTNACGIANQAYAPISREGSP